jgi:hypothetical protein
MADLAAPHPRKELLGAIRVDAGACAVELAMVNPRQIEPTVQIVP